MMSSCLSSNATSGPGRISGFSQKGFNSAYCLEIIHDLLKEEHVESSAVFVRKSRIDIIEKISLVYKQLCRSYQNRKFIFQITTDSLFINVDEIKLLQVINNLTSNAIKYSPHDKVIVIGISDSASEVTISVKDNGIGIPDDHKPLIFQSLFGAGRKGLNGEKSIGLGLSICFSLVLAMKGRIWFESEEGVDFLFQLAKAIENRN